MMAGVTHRPTTLRVAGMAGIAVSLRVSMGTMNAAHGPATTAKTPMPAKTTEAATAPVIHLTLQMAGAMARPTTRAAAGMAEIAVNRHVLTEPTRVVL